MEKKEFHLKAKWLSFKMRVKDKWHRFINRCRDLIANRPEVFIAILATVGTFFRGVFKIHASKKRDKQLEEDRRLKDCFYYDKRRGHYVETRRKLSGRELRELDRRYQNGENYSDILYDMKLMK